MATMSERQRRFREEYRSNISPLYNGLLHIGVIYAVGLSAIWWCVQRLENVGWEWLVILPVALAGNFAEWAMLKYVMHRKIDVFALRAIYDRHTRQHHQYFTDNEWTIDTTREFRIVFFPWRLLFVLGVLGTLFGWIASLVLDWPTDREATLLVLLALQVALGVANVVMGLPLYVATAHLLVAVLMLFTVATLLARLRSPEA